MRYLKDLTSGQKADLCLLRILQGKSYQELSDWVKSEWTFTLSRQSIGNFFRSDEGKEIMDVSYTQLKSEYADEPLIEKATRVLALQEQAKKLQRLLDRLCVDEREWLSYSEEFRQYIKQISVEMEGLQITVADGRSPIEVALQKVMEVKKLKAVS